MIRVFITVEKIVDESIESSFKSLTADDVNLSAESIAFELKKKAFEIING